VTAYYLCAYGHVMRISERTGNPAKAARECFGTIDRVTTYEMKGKLWRGLPRKTQLVHIGSLAQRHYDETGNVLSGCEKNITYKTVKVWCDRLATANLLAENKIACPKCHGDTYVSHEDEADRSPARWECRTCGRGWTRVPDTVQTAAEAEAHVIAQNM